jgi:hypothetical protein
MTRALGTLARTRSAANTSRTGSFYYQPAFTLVGAGVYPLARTRRAEESLIPVGVQWIPQCGPGF